MNLQYLLAARLRLNSQIQSAENSRTAAKLDELIRISKAQGSLSSTPNIHLDLPPELQKTLSDLSQFLETGETRYERQDRKIQMEVERVMKEKRWEESRTKVRTRALEALAESNHDFSDCKCRFCGCNHESIISFGWKQCKAEPAKGANEENMRYWLCVNQEVFGRYRLSHLPLLLQVGCISAETLCCIDGSENWQSLSNFL
jgi:hypothetical protein